MALQGSWIESANVADCVFPLNNLPCGVFSVGGGDPRCGVAIGDRILDLTRMEAAGLLHLADDPVFDVPFWNAVMQPGPQAWARMGVLLNDWLARDIQAWEYQPLGPFQAKATATSISPWIVMRAAPEPFRVAGPARDVALLPYLREPRPMLYDLALEAGPTPQGGVETVIGRTNLSGMSYAAAQQLCHHTTCGCPMNVGEILGSGTISGPERGNRGLMLELSWGGREPLEIAGGTRSFLEDEDLVTLRGLCRGDGLRVGFGACAGRRLPALPVPDRAREDADV